MKTLLLIGILGLSILAIGDQFDVAYGPDEMHRLDLYGAGKMTDAPTMIYVHGGAWRVGDKSQTGLKVEFFRDKGWVFVSVNYRLLPHGKHPANVEDVARAIAWVTDHIHEYGGNPDALFVMGHSAGAHLVSLVATDERPLKKYGKDLSVIKGVISLDTQAYDISLLLEKRIPALYQAAFSEDPIVWRDASPITHIESNKGIPPFLICYSKGMTPHINRGRSAQAHAMEKNLIKAGVHAEVVDASDRNHAAINQQFGLPADCIVTAKANLFLDQVLGSIAKPIIHPTEQ